MVESLEGTDTSLNTAMTETVSVIAKITPTNSWYPSPNPHFNNTAVTQKITTPALPEGNWFNRLRAT